MKVLAGVDVFSDAHQLEPVQFHDGGSPKHRATSHEESTTPALSPALDGMVEHVLFVGDARGCAQRALKDVLVIEVMRSLDEPHARVGEERYGFQEKARDRNVVCVEHDNQFTSRLCA